MIVPVGKPHSRPIIKMIAYAQHFDTCIDLRKLVITPVSSIKGSRIGTMDEYHSCNPWVHPDLLELYNIRSSYANCIHFIEQI